MSFESLNKGMLSAGPVKSEYVSLPGIALKSPVITKGNPAAILSTVDINNLALIILAVSESCAKCVLKKNICSSVFL